MWSIADLADALADGFAREEERLREEQAVHGIDIHDELGVHPIIERAFADAGLGVFREQRYPADRIRRSRAEGERCDFVLTHDALPLCEPDRADTLFDDPHALDLEDAFWLEAKLVAQFTIEGSNPRYSGQFLSVVRGDLPKLHKDPGILHAGLCVILFAREEQVAEHDLRVWYDRCVSRALPLDSPAVRHVPIADRIGHSVCTIAICPIRPRL